MGYLITLSAYAGLALMLIMPVLWLYTKKKHLNRLEKSIRLVLAFTATGFAMGVILFAWSMISLSNAALYAVVGMFFAVVLFLFWKLNSAQTDN